MAGMRRVGQDGAFGLVGRKLGHSWSPTIHALLGSAPYELIELEPDDLEGYLRHGAWRGLNVTIPYKQSVIPLCDDVSERVRRIGAANTLVRRDDGTIFGDNTDILGFSYQLEAFARRVRGVGASELLAGREALVLGSGGASKAVRVALEEVGARACVISRGGPDRYEDIVERHGSSALIVNTTPVGMYPDCPRSVLDETTLAALTCLEGVIDVVYNPTRTGICLSCERLSIPCETGLPMLVGQALRSSELFQGHALDLELVPRITAELRRESMNVALIGMPGAGKTSAGRELARLCDRPFVDLDDAFEKSCGMSAGQYIEEHGETAFRALETEVLKEEAARSGIVIACGGGVVTQSRNYDILRQNSTIVMIDRALDELSSSGRPISQARGVERLARERMPLYVAWADQVVSCTGSAEGDARAIRALLAL